MSAAALQLRDDVLFVSGHLDFTTVMGLSHDSYALMQQHKCFIVDLSGVTNSNSAGVALLLEWYRFAKEQKQELHLRCIPKQLASILRVANLESIIRPEKIEIPVLV